MKRNKKACDKCNREVSVSNFTKHYNSCKGYSKQRKITIQDEWIQNNNNYKCPYCGKEFSKFGISNHIWSIHTEEGQQFRKNQTPCKEKTPWNKGLTKENNASVAKQSNTFKERVASGEIDTSKFGHKFSDKERQHLSQKRKEYLNKNKDKHNWSLYHGQETEPERIFREVLETINEIQFYQYYMPEESKRFYELDFALPELKIDFEVNGQQHYDEDGNLTPYYQERHDYLENLGWKVIEIHYSLCFNKEKIKEIISQTLDGNISFIEDTNNEVINYRKNKLKKKNQNIYNKVCLEIRDAQKEFERFFLMVDIISDYGENIGLINALREVLNVSPTHVRRLLKKYDLDVKLRKNPTK